VCNLSIKLYHIYVCYTNITHIAYGIIRSFTETYYLQIRGQYCIYTYVYIYLMTMLLSVPDNSTTTMDILKTITKIKTHRKIHQGTFLSPTQLTTSLSNSITTQKLIVNQMLKKFSAVTGLVDLSMQQQKPDKPDQTRVRLHVLALLRYNPVLSSQLN